MPHHLKNEIEYGHFIMILFQINNICINFVMALKVFLTFLPIPIREQV
jgi:hypothetical protein